MSEWKRRKRNEWNEQRMNKRTSCLSLVANSVLASQSEPTKISLKLGPNGHSTPLIVTAPQAVLYSFLTQKTYP